MQTESTKPKLDLLVFPSYTQIIFALMNLVVAGVLVVAGFQTILAFFTTVPLLLILCIFSLYRFLGGPDRENSQSMLQPIDVTDENELRKIIHSFSPGNQVHFAITSQSLLFKAFGTFRRHFIIINQHVMQQIRQDWLKAKYRPYIRAILAHEWAHILNRDVIYAGFSKCFLQVGIYLFCLQLWASIFIISIAIDYRAEMFAPEFPYKLAEATGLPFVELIYEELTHTNPENIPYFLDPQTTTRSLRSTYISALLSESLIFILVLPILNLFFWRKLMRVREFYADARAAALLGDRRSVLDARRAYGTLLQRQIYRNRIQEETQQRNPARHQRQLPVLPIWRSRLKYLLANHPTHEDLRAALNTDPLVALGSPTEIALWTAGAVILFNLLTQSEWVAALVPPHAPHVSMIVPFLVFSAWLIPYVCSMNLRAVGKKIVWLGFVYIGCLIVFQFIRGILGMFIIWLGDVNVPIIDFLLVFLLGTSKQTMISVFGASLTDLRLLNWFLVSPTFYYSIWLLACLLGFLLIDSWIKQILMRCYRLQGQIQRYFWLVTICLLGLLFTVAIPIGNRIFFSIIYPWNLGLILLLALGGGVAFIIGIVILTLYQQDANFCPHCLETIAIEPVFDSRCPMCESELHKWLIASY